MMSLKLLCSGAVASKIMSRYGWEEGQGETSCVLMFVNLFAYTFVCVLTGLIYLIGWFRLVVFYML